MRALRVALPALVLFVSALAQGQAGNNSGNTPNPQASFNLMKTLAGTWQGTVTTDSAAWSTDKPLSLSIRVASHGNAVVHELNTGGPEVTVFYMEGDRLALVHYCDFGNRPHMIAEPLKDGTIIRFALAEFAGSDQVGHVSEGTFAILDPNHHVEDWTFLPATGKPVHAHMDFKRVP